MARPSLWNYLNELEPTLLVLVGFVLFVFPEPATSAFGAGLMLLGASWWVYEWGVGSVAVSRLTGGRLARER